MEVGRSIEVHHKPGHKLACDLQRKHHLIVKQISEGGQYYWTPIGRRFLSAAVFLRRILEIKPKVVCQVLDGRLIAVITMGELLLRLQKK